MPIEACSADMFVQLQVVAYNRCNVFLYSAVCISQLVVLYIFVTIVIHMCMYIYPAYMYIMKKVCGRVPHIHRYSQPMSNTRSS